MLRGGQFRRKTNWNKKQLEDYQNTLDRTVDNQNEYNELVKKSSDLTIKIDQSLKTI